MRRRGLRRETADLDKKIWDWSLTEPSATKTKIQNYAKNLFFEAGFESFKASDCWYRRWRSRWKILSNKIDEASKNPTEFKLQSSEYESQKINSAKKKRRNSKSTIDEINTGVPSKRQNPGTGHSNETDNLQISSFSDSDKIRNDDNQSNNILLIEESSKQVVINTDKISQNNSVGKENDDIFPGMEFSDISTQSTRLNSKYCSQLGIIDGISSVMQLEHTVSSSLPQKDVICEETLMNRKNICSLGGISDDYPIKTHIEGGRSSSQELDDKNVNTETLMTEIDSSLGQISDVYCFKTQGSISFSQINESNINSVGKNGRNCETIDVIRGNDETYLEGNMRNVSKLKTDNSFTYAANNMNDQIDPFSCGNTKLQTVSSDRHDNITTQITNASNCKSFCVNDNIKNTIQFENFVDISNESIFANFVVANYDETTISTDGPNKIATEFENTENFVEISNDSVFPSFSAANCEETTNRSNELVTELKSVGLDLCGKDQHSLELMKVINNNFNRHSEDSVNSDTLDACLMSAEFQIPGLSLGSDEIFENCRNSLFMESNYMFCENCDDFHMNEVDVDVCDAISIYEHFLSSKCSEIDQQSKFGEQDSVDKNNGEIDKEKVVFSKDGDGSAKQFSSSGRQMQRKEGDITSIGQRERKEGERYLPTFKSKVMAYTKSHTIRAAAFKFNVNENTVSDWIQAKLRRNKKQDFEPYKESKSINVEQHFLNWLESMRETQRPLSQSLISEKLKDLLRPEETSEKHSEKWLEHYLERLKNHTSKKYVMYSLSFKREVALYAKRFSQKAASRDFGVPRRRVYEWMQPVKEHSQTLQGGSKELEKRDSSSYVADATIDRNIFDWYKSQSVPPTSKQVREMGLKLYADEGYDVACSCGWWRRWSKRHQVRKEAMTSLDNHILEWVLGQLDRNVKVSHADLIEYVSKIGTQKTSKVSNGWVIRFCKRYPTILQRTPQFNTNLPLAMELKVSLFRKRIQELIGKFEMTESEIGAIDEIPIRFTDAGVRLKEQLIRKSGFDNCQTSLVISCLANGRLLPSIVIVKGSESQDLALSNEDVIVFVRENSCLDSKILLHWIKNVWPMFQTQKTSSILVSNNFQPYKDATAKREFSSVSCKHEFFPPGCLSKLQPIRVALSTAFQDGLYDFWKEKVKTTTWGDEISPMNLPSHHDIFDWTTQIHRKLAATFQEEIKSSFKKTLLVENENKFEQDKIIQSQQTNH